MDCYDEGYNELVKTYLYLIYTLKMEKYIEFPQVKELLLGEFSTSLAKNAIKLADNLKVFSLVLQEVASNASEVEVIKVCLDERKASKDFSNSLKVALKPLLKDVGSMPSSLNHALAILTNAFIGKKREISRLWAASERQFTGSQNITMEEVISNLDRLLVDNASIERLNQLEAKEMTTNKRYGTLSRFFGPKVKSMDEGHFRGLQHGADIFPNRLSTK